MDAVRAVPVNIFGEMGGTGGAVSRVVGDAGFQQHTFTDEGFRLPTSRSIRPAIGLPLPARGTTSTRTFTCSGSTEPLSCN